MPNAIWSNKSLKPIYSKQQNPTNTSSNSFVASWSQKVKRTLWGLKPLRLSKRCFPLVDLWSEHLPTQTGSIAPPLSPHDVPQLLRTMKTSELRLAKSQHRPGWPVYFKKQKNTQRLLTSLGFFFDILSKTTSNTPTTSPLLPTRPPRPALWTSCRSL